MILVTLDQISKGPPANVDTTLQAGYDYLKNLSDPFTEARATTDGLVCCGIAIVAVLLASSSVLGAQMEPREIVRRSIAAWVQGSKTGRSYSYTERNERRHLDARGDLKSEGADVSKTIFVNGDRFQELVEQNGAPLTPSEALKQLEKLLKRQNETKTERGTRLQNEKEDREIVNEVAEAFNFSLAGEDVINGRPAYVLDVTPRPEYIPRTKRCKMFSKVAGRLWVDKQDFGWPKANGRVIEPFFVGVVVARVLKDSEIEFTQTRLADGVWLPSCVRINAHAKILFLKSHDVDEVITYSEYQKAEPAIASSARPSRGLQAK
jgi:hypothetical protein